MTNLQIAALVQPSMVTPAYTCQAVARWRSTPAKSLALAADGATYVSTNKEGNRAFYRVRQTVSIANGPDTSSTSPTCRPSPDFRAVAMDGASR